LLNNKYHLSIAGENNLQNGVYKAVLFYDTVELIFYKNNQEIQRVSLRLSVYPLV
jgi:hypothetical protein